MAAMVRLAVGLVGLALVFGAIERRWGARPQRTLRRGWATDVAYWFVTPLVSKKLALLTAVGVAALVAAAHGVRPDRASFEAWWTGRTIASSWPVWAQVLGALVLGDLTAYWAHRAMHRGWLWRVHAVHHASEVLDWLAAVRLHPINTAVTVGTQTLVLLGAGFDPRLVGLYLPLLPLYGIVLHANVRWNFGPLRYVLASPAFHRWHHTSEQQGLDKNFAGLFPLWDLLFGTFYLPDGHQPEAFGAPDAGVPEGLWGQLLHPLRSRQAQSMVSSPRDS